jgi:invasion protein IalB
MPSRSGPAPALAFVLVGALGGGVAAAELVSAHSDWKVYRHGDGRDLMCFAVSVASSDSSGPARETAYAYVTTWPRQGVKAEISLSLGLVLNKDAEVTADISGTTFKLVADGDRAFVAEAEEEGKLLEAMRRGVRLTIEATTADGARIKDVLSLSGVTASIQAITSACE